MDGDSSKPPDTLPGEDDLIRLLTANLPQTPRTLAGPGDDCAVIRAGGGTLLLFKADAVAERVHFTLDMPARQVGWKALCRNISDVAAMGGTPREALVTLMLPPEARLSWALECYAGLREAAERHGAGVAGGETTALPAGSPAILSIALLGEVEEHRLVRRDGAATGDVIAVTGRLGGSFASGRHLSFTPRLREARWLTEHFKPSAMMDLSDGLAKDLPRLALAAGLGWRLDLSAIPCQDGVSVRHALTDGEDYELLFTFPPEHRENLRAAWREAFPGVPLTEIGTIEPAEVREPELTGGWEHFVKP